MNPRRRTILALCLALVAAGADGAATSRSQRVENFALLDHRGEHHELYYYSDAPAIVLFVQGNGCRIVRDSLAALRRAAERFEARGVVFLMLNANPQDDRDSIAREAAEYDLPFPVLVDETQLVAGALGISRTAEVLVVDPIGWRLAYRGPVDDRRGYGTRHATATRDYLSEALEAVLAGAPVEIEPPETQGCLITPTAGVASPAGPPLAGEGGEAVTYSGGVARLLERKCVPCHRTGGIAPFAMPDFYTVRGWSAMMREVVRTRRMPPWGADPRHGRFRDDLSLTPEETRLLVGWIESGAPRGEGPDPLADLELEENEWPLGPPDIVLAGREQEIPAAGTIPYRYSLMGEPLEEGVWLRAAHLKPSNPKVLHHALAFEGRLGGRAAAPDGDGSTRVPFYERMITKYNPGVAAELFPAGTGRWVPAGARIRVQLHYTPTGRTETDRPVLGLYLMDTPPERELRYAAALNGSFEIPPHADRHEVEAEVVFERAVTLYSLQPHMHYRGRSMRFAAHYPDGSTEILLSVPRYDFNFQTSYTLAEPKLLPAGTRVVCSGTFDNSARNEANPDPTRAVRWGLQSSDEMFIGYLVYSAADPDAGG